MHTDRSVLRRWMYQRALTVLVCVRSYRSVKSAFWRHNNSPSFLLRGWEKVRLRVVRTDGKERNAMGRKRERECRKLAPRRQEIKERKALTPFVLRLPSWLRSNCAGCMKKVFACVAICYDLRVWCKLHRISATPISNKVTNMSRTRINNTPLRLRILWMRKLYFKGETNIKHTTYISISVVLFNEKKYKNTSLY